jgi:predicted phosphate transport protein (TIGR00153 family)
MVRFIPKEEKFFEMFKESAQNLLKGAEALKDLVEDYADVERKVREIKDIEHQGDVIFHRIVDRVNKTFVTPLDREDIYELVNELDNALDAIEGVSSRFFYFKIDKPTPESIQMINIVYRAAVEIKKAIDNLKNFNDLLPFCVEINRLENEADIISREMIGKLLDEETDWRKALKWKEIYGRLETAADHCEDIANVIESIVVKNA